MSIQRPFALALIAVCLLASAPAAEAGATSTPASGPAETPSGVLIVVTEYRALDYYELKPGDVLTHLNGLPLRGVADFTKRSTGGEREFRVRSDGRERTFRTGPDKIGINITDYKDSYGPDLSAGLAAFFEGKWNIARYEQAREMMEAAIKHGLVFGDKSYLEAVYATTCYYAGDLHTAQQHFESFVKTRKDDAHPWGTLFDYGSMAPIQGHLKLYFLAQLLKEQPHLVPGLIERAWAFENQGRYLESIVDYLRLITHEKAARDPKTLGTAYASMQRALGALDLMPECEDAMRWLVASGGRKDLWAQALPNAERAGKPELATELARAAVNTPGRYGLDHQSAERLFRIYLKQEHWEHAREVLQLLARGGGHLALAALQDDGLAWPQARSMLAQFARDSLQRVPDNSIYALAAFQILIRTEQPNLAELKAIVDRVPKRDDAAKTMLQMLELAEGRYDASAYERTPYLQSESSLVSAVQFLARHGASLTNGRAPWRCTLAAFAAPGGECYLLTRDQRLGRASADAATIQEIPLPEKTWRFDSFDHAIVISPSGKLVTTAGMGRVYLLNADASGWTLLATVPEQVTRFSWHAFQPLLDDFVSKLAAGKQTPQTILTLPHENEQAYAQVLLADGRWLLADIKGKQVQAPPGGLTARCREIYSIQPIGPAAQRFVAATDQGLFEWHAVSGEIRAVPLPGVSKSGAVVEMPKILGLPNPPRGYYRFALLPGQDSTSFAINAATGMIAREGLVNESLPLTYWRCKPAEWKRQQLRQMLEQAGVKWPFGNAQPPVVAEAPKRPAG